MAVMSFLRYSRASPVLYVTVISYEVFFIRVHILEEVKNWKKGSRATYMQGKVLDRLFRHGVMQDLVR